jgi:hypothetical protein
MSRLAAFPGGGSTALAIGSAVAMFSFPPSDRDGDQRVTDGA